MSSCGAGLLIAALAMLAPAASAAVSASLDGDRVAPGDTVQLTLERDGQARGDPDLTPLQQDFDILGTSRSSSMQFINGRGSSSTAVRVTLAPKRSGRLTVPPIEWDGERSRALTLEVSSAAGGGTRGGAGAASGSDVFLTTEVDPKKPYVQAAVQVTVRLHAAEPLYQAGLELPAGDNVLVRQIGSDEHATADRNGRSYQVITRRYLVFPQRSGALTLPGPVLSAQVATRRNGPDPFFGNDPFRGLLGGSTLGAGLLGTRPIRLHGDPITLDVRPRPAGAATGYWLPARRVELTGKWSADDLKARVGDPLTVSLHLEAEGLTAAQLPDLSKLLDLPDGLKDYPDQAKLDNATRDGTVLGSRDQDIALIADQPGRFTLPALTVHWWDTGTDEPREVTLPRRTLLILPAPGQPATATPAPVVPKATAPAAATPAPAGGEPAPSHHPDTAAPAPAAPGGVPWPWISAGAVVLWLATLVAWYLSHRRRTPVAGRAPGDVATPAPRSGDPRAAFKAACRGNDARAARRSLLAWAAVTWPDAPPSGLNALAERLADPGRHALLRALDRACYAGGPWQGEAFAAGFGDLPRPQRRASGDETSALAPLYR